MSWAEVAAEHLNHRAYLRDARTLECVDCSRKLVLPRDPGGETPTPPRGWDRPRREDIRPMPAGFRERVSAELAARRASRLSPTEQESSE